MTPKVTGVTNVRVRSNELLERFPPKYPKVVCHHITEKFPAVFGDKPPPAPNSVQVVGEFDSGDGVQGLLVEINGSSTRPNGGKYHITLSLGENRKPVESNMYVDDAVPVIPMDINVTPKKIQLEYYITYILLTAEFKISSIIYSISRERVSKCSLTSSISCAQYLPVVLVPKHRGAGLNLISPVMTY